MATLFQVLQFLDNNGDPLSGGKLYWYSAGTSTPKDTYTDQGAGTPAANPVVLDTEGRPDHGSGPAGIWLSGSYKLIVKDSSGTTLQTIDVINEYDQHDFSGLTATVADLNSTTTTTLEKSSTYTVTTSDRNKFVLVNAATGHVTINLPLCATAGNKFRIIIKKGDVSTNRVDITPAGSETIDGVTPYVLRDYNDVIEIQSDGSNWKVLSSHLRTTILPATTATTGGLANNGYHYNLDASGGAFAFTLPESATVARGYTLTLKKVDSSSNAITITPDGAETIDGASSLELVDQYDSYVLKTDGSNWYVYGETVSTTSLKSPYPVYFISGLTHEQESGDPDHDIQINPGCARDYDDAGNIRLSAAIIKKLDNNWAEGTNQGGRPTAVALAANTWYHIFVIGTTSGKADAGFDTDLDATNLLADATDYTYKARVGSVYTDATLKITDYVFFITGLGRVTLWSDDIQNSYDTMGTAWADRTLTTPTGLKVEALLTFIGIATGGAGFNDMYYYWSSKDVNQSSYWHMQIGDTGTGEPSRNSVCESIMTNTAGKIQTKVSRSGASIYLNILEKGWAESASTYRN